MVGCYELLMGNQAIGQVEVSREGLYYRFRARCRLSGDVIFRGTAVCGECRQNLGIFTPVGDGEFGLDTKLPAKRFTGPEIRFLALPRHGEVAGKFVPISPEEPFAYLSRLRDAYMEVRDGHVGVVIREKGNLDKMLCGRTGGTDCHKIVHAGSQ